MSRYVICHDYRGIPSKDMVKAFPKGLYGHKIAENDVVSLLGYQVEQILSSERGTCPIHT